MSPYHQTQYTLGYLQAAQTLGEVFRDRDYVAYAPSADPKVVGPPPGWFSPMARAWALKEGWEKNRLASELTFIKVGRSEMRKQAFLLSDPR